MIFAVPLGQDVSVDPNALPSDGSVPDTGFEPAPPLPGQDVPLGPGVPPIDAAPPKTGTLKPNPNLGPPLRQSSPSVSVLVAEIAGIVVGASLLVWAGVAIYREAARPSPRFAR